MRDIYQVKDESIKMQTRSYCLENLFEGIEPVRANIFHFHKTTLLISYDKFISLYYDDIEDRDNAVSRIDKYLELNGGRLKKLPDSKIKLLERETQEEDKELKKMINLISKLRDEINPRLFSKRLLYE